MAIAKTEPYGGNVGQHDYAQLNALSARYSQPAPTGDTRTAAQKWADIGRLGAVQTPLPTGTVGGSSGADPYAAYTGAFQASLGAARGQIETGLRNSLADLEQRRAASAGIVAGLPAQFQGFYDSAAAGINRGDATAAKALSKDQIGANEGDAGIDKAIAGNKAAANGVVPFANLAVEANAASGNALLNQQAMAGRLDLDKMQADFAQQQALRKADQQAEDDTFYKHSQFASDLEHKYDDRNALLAIAEDDRKTKHEDALYRRDRSDQLADRTDQYAAAAQSQRDADARDKGYRDDADYQQTVMSPDLQYAKAALGGAVKGNTNKNSIIKGLAKAPNGQALIRELVRNQLITVEDVNKATGASYPIPGA